MESGVGYRNVTISLPESLLREVRHLAVDRGLSLSRFLAPSWKSRWKLLAATKRPEIANRV